ncbi:hypothetical protein PG984_016274 [Apiospora sp. TS-2023a]
MQFFQIAVAALASASAVYAMPAPGTDTKAAAEKKRDDGLVQGVCDGTSCTYLFQDLPCTQGTSTKQSGGGDGTPCDVYDFGDGQAYAICPGTGG